MSIKYKKAGLLLGVGAAVMSMATAAVAAQDWGLQQQQRTRARATQLFGVENVLEQSSSADLDRRQATEHPERLFGLAKGLKAEILTSTTAAGKMAGANVDMIALWPTDTNPSHLVFCNEQGTTEPGVQRLDLATGAVDTIVTGTLSCDGVRRTAWGTILFSEEAGGGPAGGRVFELYDPINTTGVTLDRTTGATSGGTGATNIVVRPALGRLSYEGFALYESGLVYYGDENRPSQGLPGGAIFKFIPSKPYAGGAVPSVADSPLASGTVYGLRLGKRSGNTDYGQGTETGLGTWIPVGSAPDQDLRAKTPPPPAGVGLTGFYRPEDIDIDEAAKAADRVRFCGPMTGNEGDDQSFGRVVCFTDGTLTEAMANVAIPSAQNLVDNYPQFAMPDNITYQASRGNWIVHEDADTTYQGTGLGNHNNDLWSCLDDGGDDDLLSDGCGRIATLRDLDAEWTGGIFDATGKHFYVSVQHNSSGKGVILDITGWK